ncbi:MAG: hypothetical protein IJC99_06840 [Clostridia bacterium]|nr:hypothetical protein [Clostridia bacterium]
MYCSKCGKQIDYNATVCNECSAVGGGYYDYGTAPAAAPAQPATPVPSTRMVGFGKALAGVIVGFVGIYMAVFAMIVGMIFPVVGVVLNMIGIALGILSLVFGVQSIKTFKALKNGPGGSPIATLVLGIAGTVFAGFTLLFSLIAFFMIALGFSGALVYLD